MCLSTLPLSADVERSFSANKRMLTKQNMSLSEETIMGLRGIEAADEELGGVNKVPVMLNMLNRRYMKHLKQDNAKKRQKEAEKLKQQAYKSKFDEIRAEEKSLHEKLEQLKAEKKQQHRRPQIKL